MGPDIYLKVQRDITLFNDINFSVLIFHLVIFFISFLAEN